MLVRSSLLILIRKQTFSSLAVDLLRPIMFAVHVTFSSASWDPALTSPFRIVRTYPITTKFVRNSLTNEGTIGLMMPFCRKTIFSTLNVDFRYCY